MNLRFGFSPEVVSENIRRLMDNGRTKEQATSIAEAYASQCRGQTQQIQDDRKSKRR